MLGSSIICYVQQAAVDHIAVVDQLVLVAVFVSSDLFLPLVPDVVDEGAAGVEHHTGFAGQVIGCILQPRPARLDTGCPIYLSGHGVGVAVVWVVDVVEPLEGIAEVGCPAVEQVERDGFAHGHGGVVARLVDQVVLGGIDGRVILVGQDIISKS